MIEIERIVHKKNKRNERITNIKRKTTRSKYQFFVAMSFPN